MTQTSTKSAITTHVLDTEKGKPAQGVEVALFGPDSTDVIAVGTTDADGRIINWPQTFRLQAGCYRLCFSLADWYESQQRVGFYPSVTIDFVVADPEQHFHVPLLLTGHGYSTYRGS